MSLNYQILYKYSLNFVNLSLVIINHKLLFNFMIVKLPSINLNFKFMRFIFFNYLIIMHLTIINHFKQFKYLYYQM
jgi:hypothetical protein